jgi:hemoglobin/transferrin/lactoferrin receptor protein
MVLQQPSQLLVALMLATSSMQSIADEETKLAALDAVTLPQLAVTATRTEVAIDEIPVTITVISHQDLARGLAADETDLFKDEPDVTFARDMRRFGATRLNIRGIENNRIAQIVDGVRLPDVYDSGGPTNFTFSGPLGVSQDFLKRVEILRGSASSLYGSDAIGGVVGYLTLDADDIIKADKNYGAVYRFGYTGENNGFTNSLLGAWRGDMLDMMLGYSRTDASEFNNQGGDNSTAVNRTKPNPQDVKEQGVIAKFTLRPNEKNKLSLTFEGRDQDADVSIKRLVALTPKTTAMEGSDNTNRWRASVEWEQKPDNMFYDRLVLRGYHQQAETTNDNLQTRTNTSATCSGAAGAGNNCLVQQQFNITQDTTGGGIQLETASKIGQQGHLFTYGVDVSRLTSEERRDATRFNLTTGTVSNTIAGDTFPMRDFPKGITDTVGLFVQDEISNLADGKLTLTPGLRFDRRKLKPEVDALFQKALTANGRSAVQKTESSFSPKLGAIWKLDPVWSLYGQVATGFRAPNYDEVNGSFRNSIQQYAISPNADLDPETSLGVELGTKWHASNLNGQFAVYDNRYKDFIENVRLTCPADPRCIAGVATTFINTNVSRVRIYGVEARTKWDFTPGWSIDSAVAYAHGENESSNQPLSSIEPARLSLALMRDAGNWGAEARIRSAVAVSRVDDSSGQQYKPAGYVVTNLSAWWKPFKDAEINVALNNLFDKKYFLWSDIRQADAADPAGVDFYSQPGRNVSASFAYHF